MFLPWGLCRSQQLTRLRGTFGKDITPRVFGIGGVHLLPFIAVGAQRYPDGSGVPRSGTSRLVSLLKLRAGPRWARELWKHIIG